MTAIDFDTGHTVLPLLECLDLRRFRNYRIPTDRFRTFCGSQAIKALTIHNLNMSSCLGQNGRRFLTSAITGTPFMLDGLVKIIPRCRALQYLDIAISPTIPVDERVDGLLPDDFEKIKPFFEDLCDKLRRKGKVTGPLQLTTLKLGIGIWLAKDRQAASELDPKY